MATAQPGADCQIEFQLVHVISFHSTGCGTWPTRPSKSSILARTRQCHR